MITRERLWRLRNELLVHSVFDFLGIETKTRDGHLRFLCPLCRDFHTATNPKTNLARCFRCRRNFNTINLVMIVEHARFVDAVRSLESLLEG